MLNVQLRVAAALLGVSALLGGCSMIRGQNAGGYGASPSDTRARASQLDACSDVVARQYDTSIRNVDTRSNGRDADGNALIEWSLRDGPHATCVVNGSDRVLRFDTGSGSGSDRYGTSGTRDNGYPSSGSETGEAPSNMQLQVCRIEVAKRYDVQADDVNASGGSRYTDGGAVVNWTTRRGDEGSCEMSKNAEVLRINRR
jgi:hypothetical protein